jgi:hypothetical protein
MSTKDIRTYHDHAACDVCGRTLLRGEHAETYVNHGARRLVCELCKTRALNEGWVREGTEPAFAGGDASLERRRSLLGRLRPRRAGAPGAAGSALDEAPADGWSAPEPSAPTPAPPRARREPRLPPREPEPRPRPREPGHVRAIPTSNGHRIATAIDLFNHSDHRRTVAGVARSLGIPEASVVPDPEHLALVRIVVAWELCWYRYEVDLSESSSSVQLDGQGYELDELDARERVPNAVADEVGVLHLP